MTQQPLTRTEEERQAVIWAGNTQMCPETDPRIESGPVQFGDDWPGTFFRGDDSAGIAGLLRAVAIHIESGTAGKPAALYLRRLADRFTACIQPNP